MRYCDPHLWPQTVYFLSRRVPLDGIDHVGRQNPRRRIDRRGAPDDRAHPTSASARPPRGGDATAPRRRRNEYVPGTDHLRDDFLAIAREYFGKNATSLAARLLNTTHARARANEGYANGLPPWAHELGVETATVAGLKSATRRLIRDAYRSDVACIDGVP